MLWHRVPCVWGNWWHRQTQGSGRGTYSTYSVFHMSGHLDLTSWTVLHSSFYSLCLSQTCMHNLSISPSHYLSPAHTTFLSHTHAHSHTPFVPSTHTQDYLADHNAESKQPMHLVIFSDALEHVAKVRTHLKSVLTNSAVTHNQFRPAYNIECKNKHTTTNATSYSPIDCSYTQTATGQRLAPRCGR